MTKKKLKILIIAPTNFKVTDQNLENSGSVEQHTYLLAESLAARGHTVTLFATKDAVCPPGVKLKYVHKSIPKNYYKLDLNNIFTRDFIQVTSALKNVSKYDYVSCHTMSGIAIMELLRHQGINVQGSTTIHWRTTDERLQTLLKNNPGHPIITISKHTSTILKDSNKVLGVVHHGLKIKQWPYQDKKADYLLFIGKVIPGKGVDLAIQAAIITNKQLVIAGRIIDERYPNYFEKEIKPYLNDKITYLGEVCGEVKINLFKNAKALVCPGRWDEQFGIVLIEAQACGTPVIAWNPGSSNDSIIKGKTGYVIKAANDQQAIRALVKAINKINTIKPKDCRENIINKYLIDKTAADYEKIIYKQIKTTVNS